MNESALSEKNKKLLSSLGLCARARGVIFGVPQIHEALASQRKGNCPLIVFEASDTSENTHKRICDKCGFYGVKHVGLEIDGTTLGEALGKRTMLGAVALTDENFVRLVSQYI